MKKFIILFVVVIFALATMLTACSSTAQTQTSTGAASESPSAAASTAPSQAQTSAAADTSAASASVSSQAAVSASVDTAAYTKKFKFGWIPTSLADSPFWQNQLKILQELAPQYNATISYADPKGQPSGQLSALEDMISQKVDGIIIDPINPDTVDPDISKAMSQGIKVLVSGNQTKNFDVFLGLDQTKAGYAAGEQAAKWINDKLGGQAEVAILNNRNEKALIDRENGIIDALKKEAPNAKVVGEAKGDVRATAMTSTENILQANPNVKVICSVVDEGAMGALEAVKGVNKASDDFGIFSVDGTLDVMNQIKAGTAMRSTIDFLTALPKNLEIEIIAKLVNGQKVDKMQNMDLKVVDQSNIDDSIKTYHSLFG